MKNAMKKLTSLLLVAVLLVGALPFAAFAAEGTFNVAVYQKVDGEDVVTTGSVNATEDRIAVADVCDQLGISADEFEGCWVNGYKKGYDADMPSNPEEVKIRLVAVTTPAGSASDDVSDAGAGGGTIGGGTTGGEVDNNDACPDCGKDPCECDISNACPDCGEDPCVCGEGEDEDEDEGEQAPAQKVTYWEIKYKVGGKVIDNGEFVAKGDHAKVKDILYYHVFDRSNDWQAKYSCTKAYSSLYGADVGYEGEVPSGDVVSIVLTPKALIEEEEPTTKPTTKPTEPKPTTKPTTKPADKVVDEEWMKDIYLYIYTNNDIISPAKRVLLNNYSIVNDHKLSKAEILSVVDDYFKATNANNGIIWKGAYQETTNITALDFVAGLDQTKNGKAYIDDLDVARSSHNVIIKVRVTGVATTSSAAADTSNPKTGDSIYTAMIVMGVSAASLAAVMYFYNKKRQTM